MITAGVEKVPDELFKQLKVGGVLVAPVGKGNDKTMTRFRKTSARQVHSNKTSARQVNVKKEEFGIFHFVPFVKES
jgi:protein-L-isoaspartate(D-aspartate) O-methyltransferase